MSEADQTARLAPHRRRAAAAVIDATWLVVPLGVLVVSGQLFDVLGSWTLWVASAVTGLVAAGVVNGSLAWLTQGQTLGKAYVGLRVRRRDGSAIALTPRGAVRMWLRHSVGYVVIDVFGLGASAVFFTGRRRALHDFVFDTEVVAVAASGSFTDRLRGLEKARLAGVSALGADWGWVRTLAKWASALLIKVGAAVVVIAEALKLVAPSTATTPAVTSAGTGAALGSAGTAVIVGASCTLFAGGVTLGAAQLEPTDDESEALSSPSGPQPAFSLGSYVDGSLLYVVTEPDDSVTVALHEPGADALITVDESPSSSTLLAYLPAWFVADQNNDMVVFSAPDATRVQQLHLWERATGERRLLTRPAVTADDLTAERTFPLGDLLPSISSSGRFVAFNRVLDSETTDEVSDLDVRGNTSMEVVLHDIETGQEHVLWSRAAELLAPGRFAWSPVDDSLAIQVDDGFYDEKILLWTPSRGIEEVPVPDRWSLGEVTWSGDGSEIVVEGGRILRDGGDWDESGLIALSADGSGSREIALHTAFSEAIGVDGTLYNFDGLTTSTDGDRIAVIVYPPFDSDQPPYVCVVETDGTGLICRADDWQPHSLVWIDAQTLLTTDSGDPWSFDEEPTRLARLDARNLEITELPLPVLPP